MEQKDNSVEVSGNPVILSELLLQLNRSYCGTSTFRNEIKQFSQLWENGSLILSSLEGFNTLKEMIGKVDIAFISAYTTDKKLSKEKNKVLNKEATEQLVDSIRSSGMGYVRLLGHYESRNKDTKEKTSGGDEETFGVFNNVGSSPQPFFQVIISLGRHFNQESVILVPAKDAVLKNKELKAGHGYWFYTKGDSAGSVEDKGVLDQAGVEDWSQSVFAAADEVTGFSRFTGIDEKIVFKGGEGGPVSIWEWKIQSLDFKGAEPNLYPGQARHVDSHRLYWIKEYPF